MHKIVQNEFEQVMGIAVLHMSEETVDRERVLGMVQAGAMEFDDARNCQKRKIL